jgi:hypothetical protein
MKHRSFTLAILLIIMATINGCKLDPVIYPGDIQPGTGTNPGTPPVTDPGTDATYTVGIGAANTFVFRVDGGPTVTVDNVLAVTQDPDEQMPGKTNLSGHQIDPDPIIDISVSASISNQLGEFPISVFLLNYQNLHLEAGTGTVKFTTYQDDAEGFPIIKGYFKIIAIDNTTNAEHTIIGSFNNE